MFKDIQVTLYDIFGYLFPGAVLLLALGIFYWLAFWSDKPLVIWTDLTGTSATVLTFASYLLGHLAQALGNLLEKLLKRMFDAARKYSQGASRSRSPFGELGAYLLRIVFPVCRQFDKETLAGAALYRLATEKAQRHFAISGQDLNADEWYDLCDQALVHANSLGDREIFTYREGFYRGNFVAVGLLAVSVFVSAFRAPLLLYAFDSPFPVGRGPVLLTAALLGVFAWLLAVRWVRFIRHKVTSCFSRFLAAFPGESATTGKME